MGTINWHGALMIRAQRLLDLLDLACRDIERTGQLPADVGSDEQCAPYGVTTKYLIQLAEEVGIHYETARRILHKEMTACRVLRHKIDDKGMMRWWPAGLLQQLSAEKTNVKEAA